MTYFLSALHHLFWGGIAFLCAAKVQNGLLNVASAILGVDEPKIVSNHREHAVAFQTHGNGNGSGRGDELTGPEVVVHID